MMHPLTHAGGKGRHLAPTLALTSAGTMLAISLFFPYWGLTLISPEHPGGLRLAFFLAHVEGPLPAVLATAGSPHDERLHELSELERSLGVATVTVICLLVVAATLVRNRWAALLSLPALAFPFIVVADSTRWLASLVGAICAANGSLSQSPTLRVFGRLAIEEVSLETRPGAGLLLAAVASVVVIGGLWLHRRAYKAADLEPVDDT